ncbi:hypothetical protein D3C83_242090 [compost metagenome]
MVAAVVFRSSIVTLPKSAIAKAKVAAPETLRSSMELSELSENAIVRSAVAVAVLE